MISVDTNILLYSLNARCDEHAGARRFMEELADRRDVIVCELVLVELYMLLRHPAVVARPLGDWCETLRREASEGRADVQWRGVEGDDYVVSLR